MIFCVVKHSIFSWNRNDFSSLKQLPSSNFCPWNCYQKVQSLITKIHHGEKKHQIHHLEVKMMTKGLWHDIWSLNNNSNSFALKVVFRHESFLSQEYSNQMGLKWESRFSRLFSWGTNFCTKNSFCIKLQSFCLNKHTSKYKAFQQVKNLTKFQRFEIHLQTVVLSFWQEKYPCHDGQKRPLLTSMETIVLPKVHNSQTKTNTTEEDSHQVFTNFQERNLRRHKCFWWNLFLTDGERPTERRESSKIDVISKK